MKKLNNKMKVYGLAALSSIIILSSCNKSLDQFDAIPATPYSPSVGNMAATLAIPGSDDSLYYKLVQRSGLLSMFADTTKTFTLFATNNAGMRLFAYGSGVPAGASDSIISRFITLSLPATTAAAIVQYNTVAQKYPTSSWGTAFPNYPLPTQLQLDPINTPFLRMTICPSFGSAAYPYYVNNLPITGQPNQIVSNGIIHHVFSIVAPPSKLLKDLISSDTALVYFRAAVARGDSGSVGLNKLDSLLGYGALNMTVLTPNNAAMKSVLDSALFKGVFPIVYAQAYQTVYNNVYNAAITGGATVAQATAIATAQAPGLDSAFSTPVAHTQATALSATPSNFNLLPIATVKGILAYHFLASNNSGSYKPDLRVFSVNIPTTPTFVKTLVNGSVAIHPGIMAIATFAGPSTSAIKFTGFGNFPAGSAPFTATAANVVKKDNHGVNGIYHVIDKVLLPQNFN